MNKREKETAAIYISSCYYDLMIAGKTGNDEMKTRTEADLKKYQEKIRTILDLKYELFGYDYQKEVTRARQEIMKIAQVFYSQRVNGEQLKYPA